MNATPPATPPAIAAVEEEEEALLGGAGQAGREVRLEGAEGLLALMYHG